MQLQTHCTGDGAGGKDEKGQQETKVPIDAQVAKCRLLNLFFPRPSDLDRSRSVFHRPVRKQKAAHKATPPVLWVASTGV